MEESNQILKQILEIEMIKIEKVFSDYTNITIEIINPMYYNYKYSMFALQNYLFDGRKNELLEIEVKLKIGNRKVMFLIYLPSCTTKSLYIK